MDRLNTQQDTRLMKSRFASIPLSFFLACQGYGLAQVTQTIGSFPQIQSGRSGGIIQNYSAVKTVNQDLTSDTASTSTTTAVSSDGVVSFDVPNAVCPAFSFNCIDPTGINPQGDIVGTYIDPAKGGEAFIRYANGTFLKFGIPNSSCCVTAVGINLEGTVAGTYPDADGVYHGFLRYATGRILVFDPPGLNQTEPTGINSLGDVTGSANDANGMTHGFVRHADGSYVTFDPSGSNGTFPLAINLAGMVTGYYFDSAYQQHGFVRGANGELQSFDPNGSSRTSSQSINLLGDATGYFLFFSFPPPVQMQEGFVRHANGNLTVFNPPHSQATNPTGISLSGAITGAYIAADGSCPAFLRQPDESFKYFAPSGALYTGGRCVNPIAINDLNIVIGNYFDQNIVQHGFFRIASR